MISPSAPVPFERLKIAFISDWFLPRIGGLELHVRDLALELIRKGHEVHVVTPTQGDERVDEIPVHRLRIRLFPYYKFICTREGFRTMESVLKEQKFDLVHCHASVITPAAYGGAYLAQKLGIPTVVTGHSIWKYFKPLFGFLDWRFKWTRWPIVFSAVSETAASYIRVLTGGQTVHILPNGLNPADWEVTPAEKNPDEILIVSVMRLNIRKRPRALIQMIPLILERLPKNIRLQVQIIGDGPERKGVEAMISRFSLGETVALLGHKTREEIREIYCKADMMVLPTILESFGLSVLEARCAGLPVVAMQKSGVTEIICHEREGLLAESDRDMVEQVIKLITHPELRSSIAGHNRETSCDHGWDKVTELHEKLYRQAIAMNQNPYRG
jgi:glycosyltransferase involved in cell wall biosynthesis